MKKLFISLLLLLTAVQVSAQTLFEWYGGKLPSISERAKEYALYYSDVYQGTKEQNIRFLSAKQGTQVTYNDTSRPRVDVSALAVNPSEYYLLQEGLLGAQNAVGGRVYSLSGSGISSSATSIGLSSFKVAGADIKLGMSDFGDLGCGTIEPGNSTRQEFVSFSGVTQNSDGTATLSGVIRGLSPVSPYTASTTQQRSHSGASQFVISNSPPCFYENYANRNSSTTVSARWFFDVSPELSAQTGTATTSNQFATKQYVDNTNNIGAATSTESTGGLVELGTLAEQANSYDGGVTQPTVLQTKNSTSTCQVVGSYNIVASSTTGKLDNNCLHSTINITSKIGIATTSPYAPLSVVGEVVAERFTATSTTATTSLTNLTVSNNASTTKLVIDTSCVGCVAYTASSTAFSVSSSAITYTGSIPTAANWGFIQYFMNRGDTDDKGFCLIARVGMTTCTVNNGDGTGDMEYSFAWSGSDFVVTEVADDTSVITGTAYWYR